VERLRPLHEKGAISDQDWDNARTALEVAEANLAAAQRAIVLTSPIRGVVTDILETVGSYPGTGDPLVRISDLSQLQVLLGVSPGQRGELAEGQTAFLTGTDVQGSVTRIAMQADPESRLIEVEVTFPGIGGQGAAGNSGENLLLPSTLATVEVVVGTRDKTLKIPAAALQDGKVWVIDGENRAHQQPVDVGLRGNGSVEVLRGLDVGENVVTAGATLLSDGVLTRVVGG
jgi:RND family efflux transporter MFP subunit